LLISVGVSRLTGRFGFDRRAFLFFSVFLLTPGLFPREEKISAFFLMNVDDQQKSLLLSSALAVAPKHSDSSQMYST